MRNPIDMNYPAGKLILGSFLLLILSCTAYAQTLFTCGEFPVTKDDFLKAYNKNNLNEKPSEKSYRDYLDLYSRYKLKVRAAYDMQLDTLPGQRSELQNFRAQVSDSYLKDEESLDRLTEEAFTRSQKDIRLAHIFIAIPANASPADTAHAFQLATAAYNNLKKGKNFEETALQYSEDPSVKQNRGAVGYITVFTLPYELETLAYSLKPGQYSRPLRTRGGYHIFKNLDERPAAGRMKAAQILISLPPDAGAGALDSARQKADSLYAALKRGADFASLARTYSGDNLSYQTGGELPEFGIGKYDSAFETAAFAIAHDGDISQPIISPYGYHIIKRIQRISVPREFNKETAAAMKQMVQADPRVELSRKALFHRIYKQIDLQRAGFSESELWAFTDSSMLNPALNSYRSLNNNSLLFSFAGQSYTFRTWMDYARTLKSKAGNGGLADKPLFERYVERTSLDYYRNHLEDYNQEFAQQLTEFKEGNLLFEVMQRKIWDKASTDSTGLRNYYDGHKDKYWWEASADAILFTCNTEKTATVLRQQLLSGDIRNWRDLADSAGAAVQVDSGRYELAQVPGLNKENAANGMTGLSYGKTDNTVSFSYVLNIYTGREPRNYHDARGFVINDYQTYLEDKWIGELKKKYPVKVDEKVFASLPK